MTSSSGQKDMRAGERMLLQLDAFPLGALYRAAIGFAILPIMSILGLTDRNSWAILPVFLGILLMLRIVPTAIRKVLPFSAAVKSAWSDRRQTAKRFDSYQWQKLFWIGAGLAFHLLVTHQRSVPSIVVSAFCLFTGALGLTRWQIVSSRMAAARSQIKQASSPS